MIILFHKNFEKQYQKLRPSEKEKFKERKNIFLQNPFHPVLHNHALTGKYEGYRSINITGDYRAIFELVKEDTANFIMVDTHSNLYK